MKQLQLKSGSYLAFEEYGDPDGTPVIFCHGWPSSLTMAKLTDDAARELAVRIISIDRPGISESTLQPNRKLSDWPPVLEQIVNYLGLDEFRVLGISGGAPYAYAAGHAMAKRTRAISVVSGAPPIAELTDHSGLLRLYRWMLAVYRIHPGILRFSFRVTQPFASRRIPIRLRPLFLRLFQGADAAALRDSLAFECCFESARRAWRGNVEGILNDAQIYADSWGFRLEDVDVPVRLWHGAEDRAFSVAVAREAADRLPNCQLRVVERVGHFSLPIRHIREILADLISN